MGIKFSEPLNTVHMPASCPLFRVDEFSQFSIFQQLSLAVCWFECVIQWSHANLQAVPVTARMFIYYKSHIDEFTTVLLHTVDYRSFLM